MKKEKKIHNKKIKTLKKEISRTTMNYYANLHKIFLTNLFLKDIVLKDFLGIIQRQLEEEWKKDKLKEKSDNFAQKILTKYPSQEKSEFIFKKLSFLYDSSFLFVNKDNIDYFPYNLLFCGLVSAFETFMKDLFILLINHNPEIKKEILTSKKKISFETFKKYGLKEISLGEIIVENYNFQNIQSIKEAYKYIKQEKLINIISPELEELEKEIQKRHNILHNSKIYPEINYTYINNFKNKLWEVGSLFLLISPSSLK